MYEPLSHDNKINKDGCKNAKQRIEFASVGWQNHFLMHLLSGPRK